MTALPLRSMGFLSCALVLVAGAAGCGVDVSQVFASSDNNTSTAGSGPGGGGQGGTGGDGGTPTTTGEGGSGGTTGNTTSSTTGNTTSSTTGSTTSSTTSTTTTTTTSMPLGDIDCGNTTCPLPGEICCWDKWGIGTGNDDSGQCFGAPVSPFDCNTEIENGGVQTVIGCQNADQCGAGEECCGEVVSFQTGGGSTLSYYPVVECRESCSWPTRVMCKTNGSTAECPVVNINGQNVQTECGPSTLLPQGFFVCRPPNP